MPLKSNTLNITGNVTVDQMIYLLSCSLHKVQPDVQLLGEADLNALFTEADQQALTVLVCKALETAGLLEKADPETARRWKETRDKAIRKVLLFDTERMELLKRFEQEGIRYMPLKGSVLKDLYPGLGMRQMTDNDILVEESRMEDVCRIMAERGFHQKEAIETDIAFTKPPVYNFEMHHQLFSQLHGEILAPYYADVWNRVLKDENNHYGYHFSKEDFYLYLLAHAHKHFAGGGIGIRTLLDQYVYLDRYDGQMDHTYLKEELEKLQLTEYEMHSRSLAEKLFAGGGLSVLTDDDRQYLAHYLDGAYGNLTVRIANQLKNTSPKGEVTTASKLRYLWTRIWPDKAWLMSTRPLCRKHPWIVPFYRFYRIGWILLKRLSYVKKELKTVARISTPDDKV